ncbi:hypothetical protein [Panacagrimonas sp.]|uniref:hypothetical protein n=1 Tax=Panacagrimonas sp. TaxID=2480088 RepID=UPI003B52039B
MTGIKLIAIAGLIVALGAPIAVHAQDEGGDGGLGWDLYAGVEFDMTTVDLSDDGLQEQFGRGRFESDFYKLRLGARLFEAVGVELHAGFPAHDADGREIETKQFYGLYFVPTGVIAELFEVSVRLGYAFSSVENELASEDLDGASYGLSVEFPLRRAFGDSMPDLRLGFGGTVYQEERDARIYGFHGGLRYDFSI